MRQAVAHDAHPWLQEEAAKRLRGRLTEALRRSRAQARPILASVTQRLKGACDPLQVLSASRRPGEPWYCLEQPDRSGFALAALGCVHLLKGRGAGRFSAMSSGWKELAAQALSDPLDGPPGSGLVAVGGFAFAPDGGESQMWHGFEPASLLVPEISLARHSGCTWLTVNVSVAPDDAEKDLDARVARRFGELAVQELPLLDPAPVGGYEVASTMPPAHYEEAVARAVQRISAGELQKVVLAREVDVRAPAAHDPFAVLGVLRSAFSSCFVYAIGRDDAAFLGATPELLIRREGQRASTVALAGTTRRSADPATDDHLGEQLLRSDKDREENAIVTRRIVRSLTPHAVWVTAEPEPALVRVANVQHLGAAIRAQLTGPLSAIELAAILHPTPAVGGEPWSVAGPLIPALEGIDRGWYAGPVGWCDETGDGEFCVALRCGLVRGRDARLYAGCGIVRASDPAAELAESEVKLAALLPLLAG